jgi:hypothetical protein
MPTGNDTIYVLTISGVIRDFRIGEEISENRIEME